jgi:RNA polymerase sigma factor (sigma-70 family)
MKSASGWPSRGSSCDGRPRRAAEDLPGAPRRDGGHGLRRFSQLYERYFDRVYAFALTRTGERTAAEDVTAETFRQALENLSRFEWRGVPFSAWLFRIAANAAADHFKRAAREQALPETVRAPDESWETRLIEVETRGTSMR